MSHEPTRSGGRAALAALSLLFAIGCGSRDDDSAEPLAGPMLSIVGSQVSMSCFGADCSAYVTRDGDGVHVSVRRLVGGSGVTKFQVLPSSPGITDLDVDFGSGNDTLVIQSYVLSGTVRVTTGDGDDDVRLLEGGPLGTLSVDLGAGSDELDFDPRILAREFRIDAGPDDDRVVIRGVCFPDGNTVLGGAGTDLLFAPPNLVARAASVDGFEERQLAVFAIESCPDLE